MKAAGREKLWTELSEAGLVNGAVPPEISGDSTPWFARVLLGVSAWLGALFLLGFLAVGFGFLFRNGAATIAAGLAICGGAVALARLERRFFFAQLTLAFSIAGQVLLVIGSAEVFNLDAAVLLLIIAILQLPLILLIGSPVHRTLSTLTGAVCLCLFLGRYGYLPLANAALLIAATVVWLGEFAWLSRAGLLRPVAYGLTLAAMFTHGVLFMPHLTGQLGFPASWRTGAELVVWGGWVFSVLLWAAIVSFLLHREHIRMASRAGLLALGGTALLGAAAWKAPGILPGLLLMLIGRANGNRFLLGLGLFALAAYLSSYYYFMELTLLYKSAVLASLGLLMLLGRWLLERNIRPAGGSRA